MDAGDALDLGDLLDQIDAQLLAFPALILGAF